MMHAQNWHESSPDVRRPGRVKTRLAGVLGADLAADLYRAMTERVVRRTASDDYARVFFHSPPAAQAEIEAWLGGRSVPQSPGDLGARMAAAFQWAFDAGASRVVLVGTDVPDLAREDVAGALEALRGSDLVIGPALDGATTSSACGSRAPRSSTAWCGAPPACWPRPWPGRSRSGCAPLPSPCAGTSTPSTISGGNGRVSWNGSPPISAGPSRRRRAADGASRRRH